MAFLPAFQGKVAALYTAHFSYLVAFVVHLAGVHVVHGAAGLAGVTLQFTMRPIVLHNAIHARAVACLHADVKAHVVARHHTAFEEAAVQQLRAAKWFYGVLKKKYQNIG